MPKTLLQNNYICIKFEYRMKKTTQIITIFTFCVFAFSFLVSCNPHRRGHTAGQIGSGGSFKKHRTPASAKVKRNSRY